MKELTTIVADQQFEDRLNYFTKKVCDIEQRHFYWFSRPYNSKFGRNYRPLLEHIKFIPDPKDQLEIYVEDSLPQEIRWECQSAFYDIFKPF
jgi:hypothetical protein